MLIRHKIAMHLVTDCGLSADKAIEAAGKVLHLLAQEGYLHAETMEWEKDVPWEKRFIATNEAKQADANKKA